ncbi:RNA polymerase sigma factor [Dechloromonas sp. XY25]|uniref:RNA polymerase sigma factor n=1 Tax=Dechloromonas hankyongensis TaxID=2908002 RepID=A0ABS9K102_9RHOO|nr:RNA polymerase sigma factor [Dechloromonas hankyongensis]MCG2576852.1 RNA polymerase sigma factor [Dechloromonas hankyongensis]
MIPDQAPSTHAPSADLDLAQAVAAGDQEAFKTLMRRHNQMLFRTARSILRDDREAEEVVQDAYLLAYRSMGRYRGEARLSTWLIRIVANRAIRRRQRLGRDRTIFAAGDAPLGEEDNMAESTFQNPEAAAANGELRHLLESHIDRLPDLYREIFVLRGVEELSNEETAAILGIPEATVRTRFFRARHLLSQALAKDIDEVFGEVYAFAGDRCDRIVAGVLARLARKSV